MTVHKPLALLRAEHHLITKVLDVLDLVETSFEQEGPAPVSFYNDVLAFTRQFVNRWHHNKEESSLFAHLRNHPGAATHRAFLIGERDHRVIRSLLADSIRQYPLAHEGDGEAGLILHEDLVEYGGILRRHIHDEESEIYPLAEAFFSDQEWEVVAAEFTALAEDPQNPWVVPQRFLLQVEDLQRQVAEIVRQTTVEHARSLQWTNLGMPPYSGNDPDGRNLPLSASYAIPPARQPKP